MLIRFIPFVLLLAALTACQPSAAPTPPAANAAAAAPAPATVAYPGISREKMQYLAANCDYIDFVFYDFDFAMSQEEKEAINTTLAGISSETTPFNPACKPIGRLFFQVDGRNDTEADLFLSDQCVYYAFLENGKYAYVNQLTPQGVGFYRNIFTQIMGQ